MKKAFVILSLACLFLGAACSSPAAKETKESTKAKGRYYCTMHPEVTADKPGTCGKCGMELVERDTTGK